MLLSLNISLQLFYESQFGVNLKMAKTKSTASNSRGVSRASCVENALKSLHHHRTKGDGALIERRYKNYTQSISSEDSETKLKIAGGADRQHAMYSAGSSGSPYMRKQQAKYGKKKKKLAIM